MRDYLELSAECRQGGCRQLKANSLDYIDKSRPTEDCISTAGFGRNLLTCALEAAPTPVNMAFIHQSAYLTGRICSITYSVVGEILDQVDHKAFSFLFCTVGDYSQLMVLAIAK